MSPTDRPRILISAGEASGDLHGANLARALLKRRPDADLFCMGGGRLVACGARSLYPMAEHAVMGFFEVLKNWRPVLASRRAVLEFLQRTPPDVVVPIDYPGFNLRLAKAAKDQGVPVVYYISPQVWAWHKSRIKTIREVVDKILVIFPFETAIYEEVGVPVEFVGHPLLDVLGDLPKHTADYDGMTIGLLPGSRKSELDFHLLPMIRAAEILRKKLPNPRFFCPIADGLKADRLLDYLDCRFGVRLDESCADEDPEIRLAQGALPVGVGESGLELLLVRDPEYVFRRKMDFALTASGTATLENAILGVPMLVIYRTGLLTFSIAKSLVKIDHIGLVNLVAGKRVCPELIQNQVRPEVLAAETLAIVNNPDRCFRIKEDLDEVRRRLGGAGASKNAAEAVLAAING